ncbi:MAG TPA: SusE domain-containing protein [Saprospiraceae bacterium]|nr:SusE domain-containing protein [Saprospiraceae bacterium]
MKKNLLMILSGFLFLISFTSCEKDEVKSEFLGGTAPKLTASTDVVAMSYDNADNVGVSLNWTNPEYQFNSGISSQNVTYLLEFDLQGANFTTPNRKQLSLDGDLGKKVLVKELNDYMLNQMELQVGTSYNLEVRVTASIDDKFSKLVSNVIPLRATPYAIPPKVTPPATGTLWMVGDATPNGWDNPLKPEFKDLQAFTKVSETIYEITIDLPGGGGYKLIQEDGVWGTQYHMLAGGTWESGDLELKDSDPQFPGPPSAGKYKITVDFQRGKFFASKL